MDPHTKDGKKRKIHRLVDVDVSHVSLVDRPANQTPFKFIKRDGETPSDQLEKPMNISLKNLFGSRGPAVTSVIADTQAKAVAVAKMLLSADASVTEQDGLFIARVDGTEPKGETVFHLGKATGLAYTVANMPENVTKALDLYGMEADNFEEAVKQEGFVPGLYIGMEALDATIRKAAMAEATNSPEAFKNEVNTALEAFSKYVVGLIDSLPEKAFKFEKALAAVTPHGTTPLNFTPEGFDAEVYDAVFGDEAPNPSKTMTETDPVPEGEPAAAPKAAEGEPAPAAEATPAAAAPEGEPKVEATPEGEPKKETEAAPANLEELPKEPEAAKPSPEEVMAAAMEAMTKTVGSQIAAALAPLTERANATDQAIDKLTKAVGGAVVTTPEEDEDRVIQFAKGEQPAAGGAIPLMDTAYAVNRG